MESLLTLLGLIFLSALCVIAVLLRLAIHWSKDNA